MTGELRRQAQEDLAFSVQSEFGQSIKLSNRDGSKFKTFIGNTNLTSIMLDPDTGLLVDGSSCFASLVLKEVLDHFGELPKSLWNVEFFEISAGIFKVKRINPDDSQGLLILTLGD